MEGVKEMAAIPFYTPQRWDYWSLLVSYNDLGLSFNDLKES